MEDLAIQKKLDLLAFVKKRGNVSEASCQSGVFSDTIYSHLKLVEQEVTDALKRQEIPNLRYKNCVDMAIKEVVVHFSL